MGPKTTASRHGSYSIQMRGLDGQWAAIVYQAERNPDLRLIAVGGIVFKACFLAKFFVDTIWPQSFYGVRTRAFIAPTRCEARTAALEFMSDRELWLYAPMTLYSRLRSFLRRPFYAY